MMYIKQKNHPNLKSKSWKKMLKSRDKVGYMLNKNYAQGYEVDDTHTHMHTHTRTHIYEMLVTLSVWLKYILFVIFWDLIITKVYQKIKLITGLSMNPIIYVSSLNFLLLINPLYPHMICIMIVCKYIILKQMKYSNCFLHKSND